MKALRILVADFEREPKLCVELEHILVQCPQPRLQVKSHHCALIRPQPWLQALLERTDPAVTFLIFEQSPDRAALDALLGQDGRAAGARPFIAVAPPGSPQEVPEFYHHGAAELLRPPLHPADVLGHLGRLVQPPLSEPEESVEQFKQRLALKGLVGQSPALLSVLRQLPGLARCEGHVLIRGETGTGKELIARALHRLSPRQEHRFEALLCAGVNAELFEDTLFGHVKGAFTGANAERLGLVARAEGGSLFLDEINSLDSRGQGLLLRVLDDNHEYRRVGSSEVLHANVRIMAATNADLKALIQAGRFREDLYYRLSATEILLPPLRERAGDILLLAEYLLKKLGLEFKQAAPRLSAAAAVSLQLPTWPGNVRELETVIRQAASRCKHSIIQPSDLGLPPSGSLPSDTSFKSFKARLREELDDREKDFLKAVLLRHQANIKGAAKELAMERRNFCQVLDRHHLRPCRRPPGAAGLQP